MIQLIFALTVFSIFTNGKIFLVETQVDGNIGKFDVETNGGTHGKQDGMETGWKIPGINYNTFRVPRTTVPPIRIKVPNYFPHI